MDQFGMDQIDPPLAVQLHLTNNRPANQTNRLLNRRWPAKFRRETMAWKQMVTGTGTKHHHPTQYATSAMDALGWWPPRLFLSR
jgi:hypothetical protein